LQSRQWQFGRELSLPVGGLPTTLKKPEKSCLAGSTQISQWT
jgi:hypothetical protein